MFNFMGMNTVQQFVYWGAACGGLFLISAYLLDLRKNKISSASVVSFFIAGLIGLSQTINFYSAIWFFNGFLSSVVVLVIVLFVANFIHQKWTSIRAALRR